MTTIYRQVVTSHFRDSELWGGIPLMGCPATLKTVPVPIENLTYNSSCFSLGKQP